MLGEADGSPSVVVPCEQGPRIEVKWTNRSDGGGFGFDWARDGLASDGNGEESTTNGRTWLLLKLMVLLFLPVGSPSLMATEP